MSPTIYPTGVTIHYPDKAHPTLVLFDGRDGKSHLIDMNGNEVRSWPYSAFPAEMIDPALTGGGTAHVFVQKEPDVFDNETLLELDWDGSVVWQWGPEAPGGRAWQAWDQARLPNGNTLIFSIVERTVESLSPDPIRDQVIYEVAPDGTLAWTWSSADHLDQFGLSDAARAMVTDKRSRGRPTLLTLNNMSPLGPNRRFRDGDTRFDPANIMIDSREVNFIAIIERATGDVVWRLGPGYPADYDFSKKTFRGPLPRPIDTISGQHDAHIIPDGLPGAGNLLLFDNQGSAGMPPVYLEFMQGSRVLEIDPLTEEIVWQYDGAAGGRDYWSFFSCFISSARRLANGNTLICEGMHGRVFQVTPDGETVWEYMNPYFGPHGEHGTPTGGKLVSWIFRAQPVPYDWAPAGTKLSEDPVIPPDLSQFRVG